VIEAGWQVTESLLVERQELDEKLKTQMTPKPTFHRGLSREVTR
jgi:hypothetical protein